MSENRRKASKGGRGFVRNRRKNNAGNGWTSEWVGKKNKKKALYPNRSDVKPAKN